MFEKILYPTDFSNVSQKALGCVEDLGASGAREVIALHVIDRHTYEPLDVYPSYDYLQIEHDLEERASEEIAGIADELKQQGLTVSTRVIKGNPLREILRVADEEHVSAIVLGSHGKGNLAEILTGSVSEKVIRKAHVPVLVVKAE